MKKRLLFLVAMLSAMNAQAQQVLPPPKPIEQPQPEAEPPQDGQPGAEAQPEQPEQQPLPPPKLLENQGNKGGKQIYMLVPSGDDFYIMVDPDKGKHLCVIDKRKIIWCRW